LTSLWSYLLFFVTCLGVQQGKGFNMPEDIAYHLLTPTGTHTPARNTAEFELSVDRFLNRAQIEHLICQLPRNEKPPSSPRLYIAIYYNLEHWMPRGELFEAENYRYLIAKYSWASSVPKQPNRLSIWRDAIGNYLERPLFCDFDHTETCDQQKTGVVHHVHQVFQGIHASEDISKTW